MEDVDYMLQNSVIDSKVFYVDSATRDKIMYPLPSTYEWQLNSPLRNVCGFEILDAAIPVTMYNVDVFNNILVYGVVIGNLSSWGELEHSTVFNKIFALTKNKNIYVMQEPLLPYTNIIETLETTTNLLLTRHEVTGTSVATGNGSESGEGFHTFSHNMSVYKIANSDPYLQIILSGEFSLSQSLALVYYTHAYISNEEARRLNSSTSLAITYGVHLAIIVTSVELEVGNYDIISLQGYLSSIIPFDLSQTSTNGDITKQSKMRFSSLTNFFLDMKLSTCNVLLGFSANSNNGTLPSSTNNFLYVPTFSQNMYTLNPPGIVNLLGIRYMILRCPELESHISGSFAYGNFNPGIGLFKLSSGNEITHQRFDFTNTVIKPFYPVGKLFRLSFFFEFEYNGNIYMYDFKGCDHNMLINIKMYSPIKSVKFQQSILNPNYDADYLRYTINADRDGEEVPIDEYKVRLEQNKYDRDSNLYENDVVQTTLT